MHPPSTGTKNMIKNAHQAGLKIYVKIIPTSNEKKNGATSQTSSRDKGAINWNS